MILKKIYSWFYAEQDLTIVSIFRIFLALISIYSVLLFLPHLKEFFSSDGFINSAQMQSIVSKGGGGNSFSIFFFNDTYLFVTFSYYLMLYSLIMLLMGIKPWFSSFTSWILYLSFYNRFPLIGYGGSEIIIMTLFFTFVTYFVLEFKQNAFWGVRLIQINTAIIYLFAGVTKLIGPTWFNGTELAAVNNSNYGIFDYSWLGEMPLLVTSSVFAATLTEVCYPFLVWFDKTRLIILILTCFLNLGIMFSLQVTFFPHIMLICSILFLKKNDFQFMKNQYQLFISKINFKYITILLTLFVFILFSYKPITEKIYQLNNGGCKKGFIFIKSNTARGQLNDFCVMKFEAKQDKDLLAVSVPHYLPWTNISLEESKKACESINAKLINDSQWLTIADSIYTTTINDLSPEDGIQLPSGNSWGIGKALGARYVDEPSIRYCDFSRGVFDYRNKFRGSLCELRGEAVNLFTQKGFFGTQSSFDHFDKTYNAGESGRSKLRTLIAGNSVIWDFAGNVWEWIDRDPIVEPNSSSATDAGYDDDGITGEDLPIFNKKITVAEALEYSDITNWRKFDYLKPLNMNSKGINGTGKIYINPGRSFGSIYKDSDAKKYFIRGGAWGNPNEAGIYSLNVGNSKEYRSNFLGFRCAYEIK
jgi:hypothetical protein